MAASTFLSPHRCRVPTVLHDTAIALRQLERRFQPLFHIGFCRNMQMVVGLISRAGLPCAR